MSIMLQEFYILPADTSMLKHLYYAHKLCQYSLPKSISMCVCVDGDKVGVSSSFHSTTCFSELTLANIWAVCELWPFLYSKHPNPKTKPKTQFIIRIFIAHFTVYEDIRFADHLIVYTNVGFRLTRHCCTTCNGFVWILYESKTRTSHTFFHLLETRESYSLCLWAVANHCVLPCCESIAQATMNTAFLCLN